MSHGKKIDKATTQAILAWLDNLGYMFIAGFDQLGCKAASPQAITAFENETAAGNHRARCDRDSSGTDGCNNQIDFPALHLPQCPQTVTDKVLVG